MLYNFWLYHYLFSNPEFSLWLLLNYAAEPETSDYHLYPGYSSFQAAKIGFDWLCFFAASNHQNLHKSLLSLA
jgi:hypothetical protein